MRHLHCSEATCTFECAQGTVRKAGNYTRDCVSGAWAGYPLECQAPPAQACPRLSPPQHAQRAVCSGMTQGDVCSFKCVAGFQPEGQAKRLWVDGARLGPPLDCRPSACPLLPVPARAAGAACPGLAVGEVCLFACQQSFEPAPLQGLGRLPPLVRGPRDALVRAPVDPLQRLPGGLRLTGRRQLCAFRCAPGFVRALGHDRRQCVAGAWTGTALTCVRQSCPELAPPAKAQSAACHTYAEGMTCLHLCAPGYVARGETTGTRCRGWGTR